MPSSAYKAIAYDHERSKKENWTKNFLPNETGLEDEVRLAKDFGRSIGTGFELPVTLTLLSMYKHRGDVFLHLDWKGYLAGLLFAQYEVPADWQNDPVIMTDSATMVGFEDAM